MNLLDAQLAAGVRLNAAEFARAHGGRDVWPELHKIR
jgi:hypothetical protein